MRNAALGIALAVFASGSFHAQAGANQVTPGDVVIEHPTVTNLGFVTDPGQGTARSVGQYLGPLTCDINPPARRDLERVPAGWR